MPRLMFAAAVAAIALAASNLAAAAADMPAQSRLGAVFTDPPRRVYIVRPREVPAPIVIPIIIAPPLPGYYGERDSFDYRSYYGTSPLTIFGRLPYACGVYGYC